MKFYLVLVITLLVSGCVTKHTDDYVKYSRNSLGLKAKFYDSTIFTVKFQNNTIVDFRGEFNRKQMNANGAILYSGDAGAGGLVAQLFVHAVINNSAQNSHLNAQQVSANMVLEPIKNILDKFIQADLLDENSDFIDSRNNDTDFYIESMPIFFLSQDLRHIILKNKIKVTFLDNKKPIYENLIEVISPPLANKPSVEKIQDNGGAAFKEFAKDLFQHSLSLVVLDLKNKLTSEIEKEKSHKFYQGDNLRVERGQVVYQFNDMVVIKNLRGWLIAYPKVLTEKYKTES